MSYYNTSEGVDYKINAQVGAKETNWSSGGGPSSMAGPMVVWPSRSARLQIVLPPGTTTWRCTLPVQGTGARIRMLTRLGESGIWNRTFPLSQWFVSLFPMNDTGERPIQSDAFTISTNTVP
jgi:hypothetical protein